MWICKIGFATTFTVITLLYGSPANAQETKASIESQASPTGLRHLVDTAILAARQQNEAELRKIIDALIIPRYDTWFVATFGQDQGGKMASLYGAHLAYEKSTLPWLFEKLTKREGELQIQDVATMAGSGVTPCAQTILKSVKKRESSFYRVGLEWNNGPNIRGFSSIGYFTFVDGAYRHLDCNILGLGSDRSGANGLLHGLPILKVEGRVQAARLVHSVAPVYPEEARRNRVSGKVRLHVLLAKDGTVEEAEVISGHPLLQDAAIEAVRQWRYQPTLLNETPVEVNTVVEVNFATSN